MPFEYPLTGFHFVVTFELFPQSPVDVRFQEVAGLSVSMGTESINEGGENRFSHKLPTRANFSDITLKRGLFEYSELYRWVKNAMKNFEFRPLNLTISLLNEVHAPVYMWRVYNSIPTKWELSSFNANNSEVVVETLVLSCAYFSPINR